MVPVRSPGIVQRHPELRWLASATVIVAGIVALTSGLSGVSGAFRDDPALPATGPEQVITRVRAPHPGGYSGTIRTQVELGLPSALITTLAAELPVGGKLLDGTHAMRYWYSGADRQRVAIVDQNSEQDVFRNGDDVLLWDTSTREAQHRTVTATVPGVLPLSMAAPDELTPPQLAARVLQLAAGASTTTLRQGQDVAGRPTYELDIVPTGADSLIGAVHIQVDGLEAVPLRVQIYPRGAEDDDDAAIDVSFQTITYGRPQARNFTFVPPADARRDKSNTPELGAVRTTGAGLSQVGMYQASWAAAGLISGLLGPSSRSVKGSWGTGRLLSGDAVSVLVTNTGLVLVGAVSPSTLYRSVPR